MESTRSSSEDSEIRKVGVEISNGEQVLFNMKLMLSVEENIENLLQEYDLPYKKGKFGLCADTTIDGTRYITDNNKWKIPNGRAILILRESAELVAENLYIKKGMEDPKMYLATLAEASQDTTILKELHKRHIHEFVMQSFDLEYLDETWRYRLEIIYNFYRHKLLIKIPSKIVRSLLKILESENKASKELILITIDILLLVRRYKRLHYDKNLFYHLHRILQKDSLELQEAALELMVFLVIFPNDKNEEQTAMENVVNKNVVQTLRNIVNNTGRVSKRMQQQLFRYQSLTFRVYWHRKVSKITVSDHVFEKLRDRIIKARQGNFPVRPVSRDKGTEKIYIPINNKRSFLDNLKESFRVSKQDMAFVKRNRRTLNRGQRSKTASSIFYNPPPKTENPFQILSFEFYGEYRKWDHLDLEAKKESNIKETKKVMKKSASLSSISNISSKSSSKSKGEKESISLLTAENLLYAAENEPVIFQNWCAHNFNHFNLANKLTMMLCRLLEVGRPRPVDASGESYQPLTFNLYPFFLEKLFCESLALFDKTSYEMKLRLEEDIPKVVAIMQLQLEYSFLSKPKCLRNLQDSLNINTYEVVAEKRKAEDRERWKNDLLNKPLYVEFREEHKMQIVDLIRTQRIKFMKAGTKFDRINSKGDKEKELIDEIKLYENYLFINEERKLLVSEIKDIEIGKSSHIYREIRKHDYHELTKFKTFQMTDEPHFQLLLSIKMDDNTYYNCCARSEQDLHYWVDGINLLINKPMNTSTYLTELQTILDMEVRLQFLEAEGLPVPDTPPVIPPLPENFDFMSNQNKPKITPKRLETQMYSNC